MDRFATILDVASKAGVSASTVSRAFNHPRLLRPETVQRIHDIAEDLGYIANRHAKALSTGRAGAVGIVVPDITNPFFPPIIRQAQRVSEAMSYGVLVAESDNDPDREARQIEQLIPQVDGLLLASPRQSEEALQRIASSTRCVLLNRDVPGVARVLLSSRTALGTALGDLAAQGLSRVCYIGGPHRSWSNGERQEVVVRRAGELGMEVTVLHTTNGTYAEARDLASDVLRVRAEVIIAFDDVVAHGVLDGVLAAGVRVPDEARLLGCDDALPIQTHPRLSTIDMHGAPGVDRAMRMLLEAPGHPVPEERVVLQGVLQYRETT